MISKSFLYLALVCCLAIATNVNAFTVSLPSRTGAPVGSYNTCLQAEESGEEETDAPSEEGGGTDILSSPAFLKRKLEVLQSDIEAAEGDIAELTKAVEEGKAEWGDQLDKLRDEYSNIQERMGNQNKRGEEMATVQVVREMLGVLDNYDRAFGAVKAESEEQKAIESAFKETYDQILQVFEDLGVTTVETLGTEFDFNMHQAVLQRPSDEYEEGICCEEFAKGFIMGETLIRAAMVAVAA